MAGERHVARKRFGQHFLQDRAVIEAIVAALALRRDDRVVEIGPGTGVLTAGLMQRLDALSAIEIDRDLVPRLRQRFPALTLVECDVLRVDWEALLPGPAAADAARARIVGNLPYNISSPLLLALLPHARRVQDQHFMLQKEVVDRMVAGQGPSMGRLSVMLQSHYWMESLFDVPPQAFDPPPRVQSSVVRMIPRPQPLTQQLPTLEPMLAAAFAQRRKMLRNSLGPWLAERHPAFDLERAVLDDPRLEDFAGLQRRPEAIGVEAWCALADRLNA